jgi:hypothetical protein
MKIFHPIGCLTLFFGQKIPQSAAQAIFRILFGDPRQMSLSMKCMVPKSCGRLVRRNKIQLAHTVQYVFQSLNN